MIKFKELKEYVEKFFLSEENFLEDFLFLKKMRKKEFLVFLKRKNIYYIVFNEAVVPNHHLFDDLRGINIINKLKEFSGREYLMDHREAEGIKTYSENYEKMFLLSNIESYPVYGGNYRRIKEKEFINFINKIMDEKLIQDIIK